MPKFSFGKLWLSPMESVSDFGFRKLCYNHGASFTWIEMLYADAVARESNATMQHIDSYEPAIPTGIQLLASKPDVLKKAIDVIKEKMTKTTPFSNLSAIDLNFGCPSPIVTQKGGGPALLKRTQRMKELLTTLKTAQMPCGVKIRLGLSKQDKHNKIYLRVLDIANTLGIDYMTVHPKIASDSSQAPVDHAVLQEIIDHATIPIVGNGFVTDGKSAQKLLRMGCSAVMIARAAIGYPWIFEEIAAYLDSGSLPRKRTQEEYMTAWKTYEATAKKYGTQEKFYEYHKKIFQMRIKGDLSYHAPSRILNG